MAGELNELMKVAKIMSDAKSATASHRVLQKRVKEAEAGLKAAEDARTKAIQDTKTQTEQAVREAHAKHEAALRDVAAGLKAVQTTGKSVADYLNG